MTDRNRLRVVTGGLRELYSCRDRWVEIHAGMKRPPVFLSWEWVVAWYEHFGKRYELCTLLGYQDEKLVAVLPLARTLARVEDGFLKCRILTICGSLELYPDHLDVLVSEGLDTVKILDAMLSHLRSGPTAWDVLLCAHLDEDGALAGFLGNRSRGDRFVRLTHTGCSPFLMIDQGLESLLQAMKRKKRYNLNREKTVLLNDREVVFSRVTERKEIDRSIERLFSLHKERAEDKHIHSTFAGDTLVAFHKDVATRFFERDQLRLYLLSHRGNPVAAAYGFLQHGTFSFYQSGFDPQWQEYSPGKVLILCAIESLCAEEGKEFDFLGGAESYKSFWTKQVRRPLTFHVYNSGLRARAEYTGGRMREWVKALGKKVAATVGTTPGD